LSVAGEDLEALYEARWVGQRLEDPQRIGDAVAGQQIGRSPCRRRPGVHGQAVQKPHVQGAEDLEEAIRSVGIRGDLRDAALLGGGVHEGSARIAGEQLLRAEEWTGRGRQPLRPLLSEFELELLDLVGKSDEEEEPTIGA